MKEIQEFYEQFKAIQATYEGKTTNWKEKSEQLDRLYRQMTQHKIPSSKNATFYEYVKRKLQTDIFEESKRVWKLSFDKE